MNSDSWRVGVLFSATGVTAAVERTQYAATMLAIAEINAKGGACGRLLEPVVYDPASQPRRYRDLAERLCDDDRVSVIFGCHMSSTRKAALPVIEARGALLFYPTLYEGFEYSKNCIYTGAPPNQNSVQLVNYIVQNFGNRVLLIGSNYVYPYESNRIIADLFRQSRGKVLDEIYVPLDVTAVDFSATIRKIKATQPNVIYSTVVGDGAALFYQAYRDAGFDPAAMPIASLSTAEAEIAQMAPGVAEGHITAAPYFASLASNANQAFVAAYRRMFGPDLPIASGAEAAYFQVHLYAAALERSGSDRLGDLLPHLYDVEFDAPQGRVKIERANNHTHLWPRVGMATGAGQFEIVADPGVRVAPDPYMLEYRLDPVQPDAARHQR
ncbi:MAG: transporter substrate-binding domain-containing protein [Azospirillaceae bacterium]|nr:transporter substrate-binding domain-containing protein [Azospirillaceae bacterium]